MRHVKHITEYVFLFVLNGIMIWFFHGYLNLVIAVGMVCFAVFDVVSVYIVRRNLSIEMVFPDHSVPKNMKFSIRLNVKNRCILPLVAAGVKLRVGNVFIGEAGEHMLTVPVRPMGTAHISYPLRSSYAGCVEVRAEQFVFVDLLSFFHITKDISVAEQIYVLPEGKEMEDFDMNAYETGMEEVEESKCKGNDFSDVGQVREYIPGDAMKNIHWKLTAKKDKWMVRERLRMSSGKLRIVLVLDRSDPERTDRAVETVFGFGKRVLKGQIPVTVFWWSKRQGEICEASAWTVDEWTDVMRRIFYHQAGSGTVEESFRTMHPGGGYVLVNEEGIFVRD